MRVDARAEVSDCARKLRRTREILIAPDSEYAARNQHALAFTEEHTVVEPVPRLTDGNEIDACLGKRACFRRRDRKRDACMPGLPGRMRLQLCLAGIRSEHLTEALGKVERRLSTAAAGLPDARRRGRHRRGDRVEQRGRQAA